MDEALWLTLHECSGGANGTVYSNSGCTVHEPRGYPLREPTGSAIFLHLIHELSSPNTIVRPTIVEQSSIGASRWVDYNPSAMNCDNRKHWSVEQRPLRKFSCQGMR